MNHSPAISRSSSSFALKNLETSYNPRPRCAVALILDTSYSMSGAPIEELRKGIELFIQEIMKDECARYSVEMSVITFGGKVRRAMPFTSFADKVDFRPPSLEADGYTPLGEALRLGLSEVNQRKDFYARSGVPYYQPWVVVMTDGQPNDDWQSAANQLRNLAEARKASVLAVGIGPQADMSMLAELCPRGEEPVRLRGLRFKELFRWLSQTIRTNSRSSADQEPVRPPYSGDFSFNND